MVTKTRTLLSAVDSYVLDSVMLRNILIRRKESDTYVANVSRHHWSSWITMKKDEIL